MAVRGAAAVPQQLQGGVERDPRQPAVPSVRPRLASQPLGCRLALPLLLPVMGQLSKRFVVQHVLASFPTFGE
jgi:hypothetical protein